MAKGRSSAGSGGQRLEGVDSGASVEALLRTLQTRAEGLTREEAARRLALHGPNSYHPPATRSALREVARAFLTPLTVILLAAALASAFLDLGVDAAIIAAMVVLSGGVNLWQSQRSARAVRALQSQLTLNASVRRSGAVLEVPRSELVPGDVIRLGAGDLVPADERLLQSVDLHVQQAALTGESLPAAKRAVSGAASGEQREDAVVYAGTSIVSGSAEGLVVATGRHTAYGDIAARLSARPAETEFERGSRRFGMLILQTITFLVLFILLVSVAVGRDPLQSLIFAVALAVGLTPEYLPMITTVTLAQGAARMAKQRVIVRHLAAIQNLGSVDALCTDKTGTLTTGQMSLAQSLSPEGVPSGRALGLAQLNSRLESGVRSALDLAILAVPMETGADDFVKVAEVPFDFERRRVSVVVGRQGPEGLRQLVTKGAPESVLPLCTAFEREGEDAPRRLDAATREALAARVGALGAEGLRVLAVAWREWGTQDGEAGSARDAEHSLVLAGFLTFADPLVEGVREVVARLHADGVSVKVLSGDNEQVARTVCRRVGLDVERLVTGAALEGLDDAALGRLASGTACFARVTPAQKHRIVNALKQQGHVVGFLGDGINDAPSLHAADVGISVANAVEVARAASDLILLEKRLDVLHAGIVAGRRSFANVLKYLLMGTSSNFGNMLSMAVAVFFLPFLPMLPTQILVNNFLYDLSQITIPTDRVDDTWLRQPRRWDIGVIRRFMLLIGPVSSLFDLLTFAVLLGVFRLGESAFQTSWFIESLATQVLVLFIIRTTGSPFRNRPSRTLALTVVGVLAFGVALPFTPLAPLLGMTPPPAAFFLYVAAVVPTYLLLVEWVKRRVLGVVFELSGSRPQRT